ncbi:hypothetical protein GW17_00018847 [Ensete ventricosum]|nr:hypothetical protein GW17_00018847 [Ensete ventricosum]
MRWVRITRHDVTSLAFYITRLAAPLPPQSPMALSQFACALPPGVLAAFGTPRRTAALSLPAPSAQRSRCRIIRRSHGRRPMASATAVANPVRTGEDLPEDYESRFPSVDPRRRRRAGVLLHPTSLPGPHGIGDLGDEAIRFLDWLHSAGASVWQVRDTSLHRRIPFLDLLLCESRRFFYDVAVVEGVLPLVPPGRKSREDGSPYSGQFDFFGLSIYVVTCSFLFISRDVEHVDFTTVADLKDPLIAKVGRTTLDIFGRCCM